MQHFFQDQISIECHFSLLINVKMPTMLAFNIYEREKMSSLAQLSKKLFITSGPIQTAPKKQSDQGLRYLQFHMHLFTHYYIIKQSGPEVIKLFSCSTQLSMKF